MSDFLFNSTFGIGTALHQSNTALRRACQSMLPIIIWRMAAVEAANEAEKQSGLPKADLGRFASIGPTTGLASPLSSHSFYQLGKYLLLLFAVI
jgi:hypothetical protein